MIKPNQGFLFRSKPPPKLNCFALFYMDPLNCPSWTHNLWVPNNEIIGKVFPPSMLDPLYDSSVVWSSYTTNYRTNFVHVKPIKPVIYPGSENYIETFLYLEDRLRLIIQSESERPNMLNFVPPNKFTFGIAYNRKVERHTVIKSHINTCDNRVMTQQIIMALCRESFDTETEYLRKCRENIRRLSRTNILGKIPYDTSIPISWKYLEYLKENHCKNQVLESEILFTESYDTTRLWYLRE